MDPKSLAVLADLPHLEEFVLGATLTLDEDEVLIDLRDSKYRFVQFLERGRLRRLTLTACITDAAGIRAIAKNRLRQLHLYGLSRAQRTGRHRDELEAPAYDPVGSISSLRELSLGDIVSRDLLVALPGLRQLEKLDLGGCHGLKGAHVGKAIAKIPHLTRFLVEGSDVDTAALLEIAASPTIVELELGGYHRMTDEVMARVAQMPALRRLVMTISHGVTDAGMAHMRTSQVESFVMTDSEAITDAGLAGLPKTLRRLIVPGPILGPEALQQLDGLRDLSISFFPDDRAEILGKLRAAGLRRTLRTLTLEATLANLDSLRALLRFPNPRRIDLGESQGEVSSQDLALLQAQGIDVRLPRFRDDGAVEITETLKVRRPKRAGEGK